MGIKVIPFVLSSFGAFGECAESLLKQLRDDFGAKVVRDIRNAIGANPSYSLLVSCHSNLAVFDENLAGWPIKDDVSAKQLITEHLKYCVTEGTQTHTQEACADGRRPRSDEQPEQQCAQDETAQTQERVDAHSVTEETHVSYIESRYTRETDDDDDLLNEASPSAPNDDETVEEVVRRYIQHTSKASAKAITSERHHHTNSETTTHTTEETESQAESSEVLPIQASRSQQSQKSCNTRRKNKKRPRCKCGGLIDENGDCESAVCPYQTKK